VTTREAIDREIVSASQAWGDSPEWHERRANEALSNLRRSGYLLVSEAELATALERYALEGDDMDDDERYGPVIAISLPTGHPTELAAAIFAALVAAQEKGETG
jgi:hypothetical protein